MNHGKQIRLFLTDGSASGIRYAELMNWTGQAFACPRILFSNLLKWPETQRAGVYVIVGEDADGEPTIYIGESENVAKRLSQHLSAATLAEIVEAFFFTSKDDNLTKGHIAFLEQRLFLRARDAKQYKVKCDRKPGEKMLSKPEAATMEEFLENLYLVAAALGYRAFETPPPEPSADSEVGTFRLVLENAVVATGYPSEEGFVIKQGSFAKLIDSGSLQAGYRAKKEDLKKKDLLVPDRDRLRFTQDCAFSSSSAAAGIVAGSPRSGPQSWIREQDGKSLKDLDAEAARVQEEAITASQPETVAQPGEHNA